MTKKDGNTNNDGSQRNVASMMQKHYAQMRELPKDSCLLIIDEPEGKYHRAWGYKIRTSRRNSTHMEIETLDGNIWRWPMSALFAINQPTLEWVPTPGKHVPGKCEHLTGDWKFTLKSDFDASYIAYKYPSVFSKESAEQHVARLLMPRLFADEEGTD